MWPGCGSEYGQAAAAAQRRPWKIMEVAGRKIDSICDLSHCASYYKMATTESLSNCPAFGAGCPYTSATQKVAAEKCPAFKVSVWDDFWLRKIRNTALLLVPSTRQIFRKSWKRCPRLTPISTSHLEKQCNLCLLSFINTPLSWQVRSFIVRLLFT